MNSSRKKLVYAGLALAGLAFVIIAWWYIDSQDKGDLSEKETHQIQGKTQTDAEFTKEGELFFTDSTGMDTLKAITIEIADNTYETTKGLMYRRHMPENWGMLFIFPKEEPRNFWMKNTHISLDIIFADQQGQIKSIAKYAKPKSTEGITSGVPVLYVLEVNSGFCDIHNIKEGQRITFDRTAKE